MQLIQSGPGGIVVEALTGLFTVFESAEVIVLCKFSLIWTLVCNIKGKGEFYRQTRTPFKHIFVKKKKLFNCAVFDERKRQNTEDKGKTHKAKFRHRTRIVLVGHR